MADRLTRDGLTIEQLHEYGRCVRDSTGCLIWTAARTKRVKRKGGYGVINLKGEKTQYAHRLVVNIRDGRDYPCVMHSCDRPHCVDPEHLQGATVAANNADMAHKGRARGVNSVDRATWDETWMRTAQVMALRSRCVRRAAGCVLVSPENRVLATGFNGPPAGLEVGESMCDAFCPRAQGTCSPLSYDDCVASHAESNALMHSERITREGGTAYITTAACFSCAKQLANSGIATVKMRILPQDAYRDPLRSVRFLMSCGVYVELLP